MKIVVALDGELLVPRQASLGIQGQREAIVDIVNNLSEMVDNGHQLVIIHGNGPQVGNMLLRAEIASQTVHTIPLDVCGADTQGATGYLLQQALHNRLHQKGLEKDIATLVTQVIVDKPEPAGAVPIKGIGPFFDQEKAQAYETSRGWKFVMIPGHGYQRAVPALLPRQVIEANSIHHLLEGGVIVICAGGGGIPVWTDANGKLVGVEAVVDKAYTAALLARKIKAETIIFVSPRESIERAFTHSVLDGVTCLPHSALSTLLEQRADLEDSIRTKLIASQKFFRQGGRSVLLVSPEQLGARPYLGWGVRLLADEIVSDEID